MKNIAYFCRTPIQVFRTIQLQIQINVEKKADCFIFDSFAGSKKIYENIKVKKWLDTPDLKKLFL